jgi:hypothetical protein
MRSTSSFLPRTQRHAHAYVTGSSSATESERRSHCQWRASGLPLLHAGEEQLRHVIASAGGRSDRFRHATGLVLVAVESEIESIARKIRI